jgi:hypothetical protein
MVQRCVAEDVCGSTRISEMNRQCVMRLQRILGSISKGMFWPPDTVRSTVTA